VHGSSCLPLSIRVRSKNLLVPVHVCSGRSSTLVCPVCAFEELRLCGINTSGPQAVYALNHSHPLLLIPKMEPATIHVLCRSVPDHLKQGRCCFMCLRCSISKTSENPHAAVHCFFCCSLLGNSLPHFEVRVLFEPSPLRYKYLSIPGSLSYSHLSAPHYFPEGHND
jgi:hypothetical protein